jgi:hypothetical protein
LAYAYLVKRKGIKIKIIRKIANPTLHSTSKEVGLIIEGVII